MEEQTQALRSARRRLGRGIASALTVLLAFSGLQLGSSAALADDSLVPSVTMLNGGKTSVASYDEEINYQAQITVPTGASVLAGSQTVIELPSDLMLNGYSKEASSVMGASPEYDVGKRTLTVTWKELVPGSLYSFPFSAMPSPSATSSSSFVVRASTTGTMEGGRPFSVTQSSSPISLTAPAAPELVQPGDWILPSELRAALYPGQSDVLGYTIVKKAGVIGGSFNDLRWRVKHEGASLPGGTIGTFTTRPATDYTVVEDSDSQYYVAQGPMRLDGKDSLAGAYGFRADNGLDPGTYTAPVELIDIRPNGVEVVIAASSIVFTVLQPDETEIKVLAGATRTEVAPGELLRYQYVGHYRAADPLKDVQYVLPVPEGALLETFSSGRRFFTSLAKRVEYTTDGTTWTELKGRGGVWRFTGLSDLKNITSVKVTQVESLYEPYPARNTMTFRVADGVAEGSKIIPSIESVSFFDPVGGSVVTQHPEAGREVAVVGSHTAGPLIAANNVLPHAANLGFERAYFNGDKISQDIRMSGLNSSPLEDPYLFVIVPAGMSVSATTDTAPAKDWGGVLVTTPGGTTIDSRMAVQYSAALGEPAQAESIGTTELSDGSTLYYWKAKDIGLTGNPRGGTGGVEMMLSDLEFSLNTMQQGAHTVQIGMGSSVQDSIKLDASRSSAGFAVKGISQPDALGDYKDLRAEVRLALQDIGITAEQFVGKALSFSVPASDSVSVESVIKGSEDKKPITGSAVATTQLGATTEYRINVKNSGTYAYENFQFIDVFPHANDTYTLSSTPRNSKYDLAVAGLPVLKLNGKKVDATLQVSKSSNPPRFDTHGDPVPSPGNTWEPIAVGTDGAKALRVTLGSGVKFNPGDVLTVDFVATVPLSAPRDGSAAYNSVAYRLERPGFTAGLEKPAGGVKVPAPASDIELSGRLVDTTGSGLNGGVEMRLFKVENGKPKDTGQRSLPATSGDERGVWGFVGINDRETYLVKPVSVDQNYTVNASLLDDQGFLKYVYQGEQSDKVNGGQSVASFDGKSQFPLGDTVGFTTKWLKDLRVQAAVNTVISGDVVFVDNAGKVVSGADAYTKNWRVKAQSATKPAAQGVADTGANGVFNISDLEWISGKYAVSFTDPLKRVLAFPESGQPQGFDRTKGVWTTESISPSAGVEGLRVRVTDTTAPTIVGEPVVDAQWNPTKVTVSALDVGTEVTGFTWTLTGSDGFNRKGTSKTGSITVPQLSDGTYTMSVQAVDLAGNLSLAKSVEVRVDHTPPTLTAGKPVVEVTAENPLVTPKSDAEWIALFEVSASDQGSGMPSSGSKGITVDAKAVNNDLGEYSVTFTATDIAGNTTKQPLESTFKVSFLGKPAVEASKNSATHEIKVNSDGKTFTSLNAAAVTKLFGATAKAAHPSAEVTKPLQVKGLDQVEWGVPATYDLFFQAIDVHGTKSELKKVSLVVEDTQRPTVAVRTPEAKHAMSAPSKDWTAAEWTDFFGASAEDSGTGVDEATWTVLGADSVEWTNPGRYELKLKVKDVAGNESKPVAAVITIQAPPEDATHKQRVPQNELVTVDPARLSGSKFIRTLELAEPTAGGTAKVLGGKVNYTPRNGFSGEETLAVTVTDDLGQTGLITYAFTVVKAPGLPEGPEGQEGQLSFQTVVDQPLKIKDAANLVADGLTLGEVTVPGELVGAVEVVGNDIVYTTGGLASEGTQRFTFEVEDDLGQTGVIPVVVSVLAPTVELSAQEGVAGKAQISVSMSHMVPGGEYVLEMHSKPVELIAVTADTHGVASARITVPKSVPVGAHHVVLLNNAKEIRATAEFKVVQDPASGAGTGAGQDAGALSVSGASPAQMLGAAGLGAVLLMLAGLLLVAAYRKARVKS